MAKGKEKYNPTKALIETLPVPTGEPDDYWEKNLEQNDKLKIIASLRNAFPHPHARRSLGRACSGSTSSRNQVVKRKPPPFDGGEAGAVGRHRRPAHRALALAPLPLQRGQEARDAGGDWPRPRRPFHPVREYFAASSGTSTPRLATWLATYCGASENEYTQLAGVKFLDRRRGARDAPGCKMDNVLILEGEQGRWKSTALATLAGEWFGDTPFAIGDKDSYLQMRGNLIYELAELDGFSRAESSRAKAFFSSRYDTFVPKYVAWAIKVPRQLVFAGTVNHGTYLRDTTGNRRYWPVKIERADIDELARDRDQLWAEAVHRFNEGERWWVEESERELFSLEQELRYVGDAYEDLIREWALGKERDHDGDGAGRLPAPRKIEVDTCRADASRRGAGDPRLRQERTAARRQSHGTCTRCASENRARRADARQFRTYSAPTPHPVRNAQIVDRREQKVGTSAPPHLACVYDAGRARTRVARTRGFLVRIGTEVRSERTGGKGAWERHRQVSRTSASSSAARSTRLY
jgi:hypothetical protein